MAGKVAFRLLIVATLAFYCYICFIDLPTSSAAIELDGSRTMPSLDDASQMHEDGNVRGIVGQDEQVVLHEGRMELEVIWDYPGSGANNRHTPNPPAQG